MSKGIGPGVAQATFKLRRRGASLALVVGVTLGIILTVFFVILIYNQLFTHQREAQTAVDAAALAVAKEIGAINVFDANLGPVGVIDQLQNNRVSVRPIYGINTLVGRARLDTLFATRLGSAAGQPNRTMLFLARQDAEDCRSAATRLSTAIRQVASGAQPLPQSPGRTLRQIAADAYNANDRRAGGQGNVSAANVTVTVGFLSDRATTLSSIPVPTTNDNSHFTGNVDQFSTVVDGTRLYRANMNIPVTGVNERFVLSPIGDRPRLVDRGSFVPNPPDPLLVPSVVRVEIRQQLTRTNPKGGDVSGQKIEVACATAGGARVPTTAGIFRLEFPQGIPQDDQAPNTNVFRSVRTIMNASDLAANGSVPANPAPWSGNGVLFTPVGKPFPNRDGEFNLDFGQIPRNAPGDRSIQTPNPSIALASYVYHWLRNDCLRPNVDAIVGALSANLRQAQNNQTFAHVPQGPQTVIAFNGLDGILVQKAWAQGGTQPAYCNNIFGAIFDLEPDGTIAMGRRGVRPTDLRSLANAIQTRGGQAMADAIMQAFVFRMQASTPQQLAFADRGAIATGISQDGLCPTSTDGQPLDEIEDYVFDLARSQAVATRSFDVARKVIKDIQSVGNVFPAPLEKSRDEILAIINNLTQQILAIDAILATLQDGEEYQQLLAIRNALNAQREVWRDRDTFLRGKQERAQRVEVNAQELIINTNALISNMLALSARGIDRVEPANPESTSRPRRYLIARAIDYFPPESVSTRADILGNGGSPTGQTSAAPGPEDWINLSTQFINGNPNSFDFQCTSVVPTNQTRNFRFVTSGDASFGGGGTITLHIDSQVARPFPDPTNPGNFAGNFEDLTGVSATLQEQSLYQGLNIYQPFSQCTLRDNTQIRIFWSIMAQDNASHNGNPEVDLRDEATDQNRLDCGRSGGAIPGLGENEQACDNEAVRFQITSPFPVVPIPEPIPVPPVDNFPDTPPSLPPPPPPAPPPSH